MQQRKAGGYKSAKSNPDKPVALSTQPSLPSQKPAAAALAILGRDGECEAGTRWTSARVLKSGLAFDITCTGPDLPAAIEPAIASGALIALQHPWVGSYRLVVRVEQMIVSISPLEHR